MAPILKYPLQRIEGTSDYVKINVLRYTPPGLGSSSGGLFSLPQSSRVNRSDGRNKNIEGTIILPIPLGLRDRNSVSWGDSQLNGLAGGAIKTLQGAVDQISLDQIKDFDSGMKAFNKGASTVSGALSQALASLQDEKTKNVLKGAFISQAVNIFGANVSLEDFTSRTQGVVLNPNLELIFKGVDLRTFAFSFEFTPRSAAESLEIKKIINTFKRRSAAKSTVTATPNSKGLFIQAPDVFEIEFRRGGEKHPFLFSMKTCALKNVEVSYSDTGAYTTYEDSTPIKMTMILTFTELNPIYAEDYSDNLDEGVGF